MDITIKEKQLFKEIEQVRQDIISQDRKFSFVDYGAGSPDANLDKNTMYKGVKKTLSTKQMCSIGLKNNWAEFLYNLVKTNKPNNILELGTCCGFSSIYMSKASKQSKIYTIEGSEELAKIAKDNMHKLSCDNIIQVVGRFQDVLEDTLKQIQNIDFAFIDGHHDKIATIEYYKQIKPYLSKDSIVVFDDISWSKGMKEAWEEIIKDTTIIKSENLEKLGVCYINKG